MDGSWNDPADEWKRLMLRHRHQAYDIGHELNLLYDDIEAGMFGDAAKSGAFAQYVRDVKNRFPKPKDSV
jgi:hypothetical protein